MDGETLRPSQKAAGQQTQGPGNRAPLFVDVRHNRGVVAHRGHMVTGYSFLKSLKTQKEGLHFEKIDVQQLLLVGPHPGHGFDRGGEHPTPTKTRPNTGADPAQVPRIEPPSTGDPSPSTKTDPVSLPPAKPPEAREGLTRGTTASSDATARSASEDDREEPTAPPMPGDRESPAKAELGEIAWNKISPLP